MNHVLKKVATKGEMQGSFVVRSHKKGRIKWRRGADGQVIVDIASMKAAMRFPDYSHPVQHNRIVSSSGYGRNLLLRQMSGDTTYPILIDSASIGTDNTAPADGQTGLLASAVSGIPVALFELSNDTLVISFFIPDGDLPDDDYFEFGMLMGSRLFSRALLSPQYSKTAGNDTTVEYTVTFSAV